VGAKNMSVRVQALAGVEVGGRKYRGTYPRIGVTGSSKLLAKSMGADVLAADGVPRGCLQSLAVACE
jgi:hypothetical protein